MVLIVNPLPPPSDLKGIFFLKNRGGYHVARALSTTFARPSNRRVNRTKRNRRNLLGRTADVLPSPLYLQHEN